METYNNNRYVEISTCCNTPIVCSGCNKPCVARRDLQTGDYFPFSDSESKPIGVTCCKGQRYMFYECDSYDKNVAFAVSERDNVIDVIQYGKGRYVRSNRINDDVAKKIYIEIHN